MSTALTIGKFYPPHCGHLALIRDTTRHGHTTVLVMATQGESIPLSDRVTWLKDATAAEDVTVIGILDDAPVDYGSTTAWAAHSALIKAALRHHQIPQPDIVVSSEPYGARLAAELGAEAQTFDPARATVPISGTAIRSDLIRYWHQLPEATRLGLATRVIVIGAESTGTTTLATELTTYYRNQPQHAGIRAVPEYGRQHTYELYRELWDTARQTGKPQPAITEIPWSTSDFAHVAATQTRCETEAALAHPLVICDTDAFATMLWERRYLGPESHGAHTAATLELPRRDLYLLTDPEGVPFEQDGWRDGEHVRLTMHDWFIDELTRAGHSWFLVQGNHEERLNYAVQAINELWARRTHFTSPRWADTTVIP